MEQLINSGLLAHMLDTGHMYYLIGRFCVQRKIQLVFYTQCDVTRVEHDYNFLAFTLIQKSEQTAIIQGLHPDHV